MLDDLRSLVIYNAEGNVFWSPHVVEATKLLLFFHIYLTICDILDIVECIRHK